MLLKNGYVYIFHMYSIKFQNEVCSVQTNKSKYTLFQSFVVSQFTCCYVEILTSTIVMLEQQLALASGKLPLISLDI